MLSISVPCLHHVRGAGSCQSFAKAFLTMCCWQIEESNQFFSIHAMAWTLQLAFCQVRPVENCTSTVGSCLKQVKGCMWASCWCVENFPARNSRNRLGIVLLGPVEVGPTWPKWGLAAGSQPLVSSLSSGACRQGPLSTCPRKIRKHQWMGLSFGLEAPQSWSFLQRK